MQQNISRRLLALAMFAASIITAHVVTSTQAFVEQAQETYRFLHLVRADFFAGMEGNQERFNKAMRLREETLAKNPKHAEAKVYGADLLTNPEAS